MAFLKDVQSVYTGGKTYAQVALRWGFINKSGKPVPKMAWQMAHALFEIKVVPKEQTLATLEMLLGAKQMEVDDLREQADNLKEARVFRLK